jgi:hypothetical protein
MRYLIAISILSALALFIAWQPSYQLAFWQDERTNSALPEQIIRTSESKASLASSIQIEQEADAIVSQDLNNEIETFIPDPDAISSMKHAREYGDPRAPKLAKHHEREKPTEAELADHEQYIEYERRQQKRVYRAYVEASKIKTAQLRSMIEKGKAEGISDEDIAFAEEKIRGIEEMALQLQQDHPDIMEDSYQPPADWLIENLGKEQESEQNAQTEANIEQ